MNFYNWDRALYRHSNGLVKIYKRQMEKKGYNIILAARLSGTPHIGTLVNFMVGYKLAFELSTQYL